MIDFVSYVLFMLIGIVVAAFLGWSFMGWYCSREHGEASKTWMGAALTAIIAIFTASR